MSPLSALHDSVEPAIASLAIAAAKRRLVDAAGARQLATRLSQSGANGVAGIRRQLERESTRDGTAVALMRLLPPKDDLALGPYQVLAHLASGGMGHVWLGKASHGPLVVIKTMREGPIATPGPVREDTDGSLWIDAGAQILPGMPTSPDTPPTDPPQGRLAQRFVREARLHRQLAHLHVVRMLDHGTASDGTLFMALEYVPGGDLRDLVDARGPLPEAAALTLVRQVAEGLAAAHALGLLHRDIKPGNVFIAANGTAKLADFGLARSSGDQHTHLTGVGDLLGSPAYMAPERIDGGADGVDIRSDIYSLGALLFYLLTGRAPYIGSTPEVLHQHRTAGVPDICRIAPRVSAATAAIIQRCLAKCPEDRFATPTALRNALAGEPASAAVAQVPRSEAATAATIPPPVQTPAGPPVPPVPPPPTPRVPVPEVPTGTPDGIIATTGPDQDIARSATPIPATREPEPATASTPSQAPVAVAAPAAMPAPVPAPVALQTPSQLVPITAPPVPSASAPLSSPAAALEETLLTACVPVTAQAEPRVETLTPSSGMRITPPLETLDSPWIALRAADQAADPLVLILPRPVLVLGKLRADDVDLCLRNYPVVDHITACQRLSRRHLRLAFDPRRGQVLAEDLGSANGSRLDGAFLSQGHPQPLVPGRDHLLDLGGVVRLTARVIADRRGKPGAPPSAVVITRPDNRPGLVYVMLLGTVRIGGPGADVVVGGAGPMREFTRPRRHWWWRDGGDWNPLVARSLMACGTTALRPEAGTLAFFD